MHDMHDMRAMRDMAGGTAAASCLQPTPTAPMAHSSTACGLPARLLYTPAFLPCHGDSPCGDRATCHAARTHLRHGAGGSNKMRSDNTANLALQACAGRSGPAGSCGTCRWLHALSRIVRSFSPRSGSKQRREQQQTNHGRHVLHWAANMPSPRTKKKTKPSNRTNKRPQQRLSRANKRLAIKPKHEAHTTCGAPRAAHAGHGSKEKKIGRRGRQRCAWQRCTLRVCSTAKHSIETISALQHRRAQHRAQTTGAQRPMFPCHSRLQKKSEQCVGAKNRNNPSQTTDLAEQLFPTLEQRDKHAPEAEETVVANKEMACRRRAAGHSKARPWPPRSYPGRGVGRVVSPCGAWRSVI